MMKIKEIEYPLNLFQDIVNDYNYVPEYSRDQWLDTINYMIDKAQLSDRYREVLELRYVGKNTTTEISNMLDLSRKRISDMLNKSLRLLRHPRSSMILKMGYRKYIEKEKESCSNDDICLLDIPLAYQYVLNRNNILTVKDLFDLIGPEKDYSKLTSLIGVGKVKAKQIADAVEKALSE